MFACLLVCFCTDEISEVKDVSINFVRETIQKKGASFTYILVPFSDPGRLSINTIMQSMCEFEGVFTFQH